MPATIDASVVLPTYNEIDTVVNVIKDVRLACRQYGTTDPGVELIVVDDDSPDGTAAHVRQCFEDSDRVRVIVRTEEAGLSSAVLAGLEAARADVAVVMDADGQHPAEAVPALLAKIASGADLAVGSRHRAGGGIEGWSRRRQLVSRTAATIARAGVPPARQFSDPMSGMFAVNLAVFDERVRDQTDPHGYKILLELATQLPDAEVAEVPITFRERQAGESKLTLDEQLRFLEHVATLAFVSRGVAGRVQVPLLIRSLEVGVLFGAGVLLLFTGLIIGDVDGAGGAALIAGAGGLYALAMLRAARAQPTWEATDDRLAKEGSQ